MCEKLKDHLTISKMGYECACNDIMRLKSPWGLDPWQVEPTLENIHNCTTLPRIERICKNAKEKYLQTLNLRCRADNFDQVFRISSVSSLYCEALRRRQLLLDQLEVARENRRRCSQSIKDLLKTHEIATKNAL